MAVRSCYFIVEDDGTFWRLPKKTFCRILQQRDGEVHEQFAGQRVRYAALQVAYDGSRPMAVQRATFHSLKFDQSGHLDDDDVLKQQELVVQLLVDPDDIDHPGRREARVAQANEELDLRFGWRPSDELRQRLYDAALANSRPARRVN